MKRLLLSFLMLGLALGMSASPARAYHAATHAGLTERAALASSLHKRLIERLGRPLGLFEPLTLDPDTSGARRELLRRLGQLDREGGLVPERDKLTVLGWLTAGAAFEGVPAWRTRNHFYDPARGGLDQVNGEALRTRLHSAGSGVGSVRGVFTGEGFDGSGQAAPDWMRAPDNEWGLGRFVDEMARAVTAPTQTERDGALARALLAAGAIVHLVEDMGDPTLVRDDYRVALEADDGPYERFVVARYGRLGVPELGGAPVAAPLRALFHTQDGQGLADRTQARFFSPGTLPDSGRYALPRAAAGLAAEGWATGAVRHLVRWQRTANGLSWSLDERCYADYAAALLPETARYAAGALEQLFRGRLEIVIEGDHATVRGHDARFGAGQVTLLADVGEAPRQTVATRAVGATADGDTLYQGMLPAGTRKVAALFRGVDADGEPLVVVQEQLLK